MWRLMIGGLLCLSLGACTGLFFHPSQQPGAFPDQVGLAFEEVLFDGEAGELYGWWLPGVNADAKQSGAKGTIVFAHGNAGNISSHLGFVYWLPRAGYNVFMFDYRGYGRSEGEPSATGIVDDTQRAIAYVQQRAEAVGGIVLYGHSLGGATGLSALATLDNKANIKGAIIDSAFASYRSIAQQKVASHWLSRVLYPLVPLLITSKPVPEQLVTQLSPLPLYITHSPEDEVIPISQGRRLFDHALEPKQFYQLKAKQHNHGWQQEADRHWFVATLEQLFSSNITMAVDLNKEEAMLVE